MPNMHRAAWGFMQSGDFPIPVGYWKLGKNTGDVAYDSSPEGNDGDIEGATWVKGRLGPGLSFDGEDDYVDCGSDSSILPDIFTVVGWFKYISGSYNPLVSFAAGSSRHVSPIWTTGKSIIMLSSTNYRYFTHSPIDLDDKAWHFLAFVLPGAGQDDIDDSVMYADGRVQVAQTPTKTGAQWTKDVVHIGRAQTNYGNSIIDEVMLFDVVLTAAQIRELYQGFR